LTKTVYFFIDGVQVASLTYDVLPPDLEPEVFYIVDLQSYDDFFKVIVTNVLISRSV
jgi:hypothetical protein